MKVKTPKKFKLANLVCLMSTKNNTGLEVVPKIPKDVQINLTAGTFTYRYNMWQPPKTVKIGEVRQPVDNAGWSKNFEENEVVGIFDRTKLRHLQNMIDAVQSFERNKHSLH